MILYAVALYGRTPVSAGNGIRPAAVVREIHKDARGNPKNETVKCRFVGAANESGCSYAATS